MSECLITFRSITGAQMGAKLLNNADIYHKMARTPKNLSTQGCGYTIRVREQLLNPAISALQKGGAPYQRVYCTTADGRQEAWLG